MTSRFQVASDRSAAWALTMLLAVAAACGAGLAGCAADGPRAVPGGGETPADGGDWGDDTARAAGRGGPLLNMGRAAPEAPTSAWAIVLGTYTGADHAASAANMLTGLSSVSPELRGGAWVHSDEKGSTVAYGRYDRPDGAEAQKDLEWVKKLTLVERPVFPRAMLALIPLRAPTIHPLDIVNARRLHPDVKPLYSLQVAVWGDFESGALRPEEIRAAAIKYAQELRSQGYEAWFSVNEPRGVASVTIGLFDHRAIDSRSNLYSPEVEALVHKFPYHLVNGEPLLEPVDRRRPNRDTRPQQPRLVLVPE